MERLISELLDLPEQVHRGDFVLNLSEGVTADKADRTLADYVATPQLGDAFDNALGFIKSAIDSRHQHVGRIKQPSPQAGRHPPPPPPTMSCPAEKKPLFMAVLHLLLQHDA